MAEDIKVVEVKIIDVAGYLPGASTSMNALKAKELEEAGRLEIVGERKSSKKAPEVANKKLDKGGE